MRLTRTDSTEYYVALADGVQRIGEVAADLIRFTQPHGRPHPGRRTRCDRRSADCGGSPRRHVSGVRRCGRPSRRLRAVASNSSDAVDTAVLVGNSLPIDRDGAAVELAQADGPGPGSTTSLCRRVVAAMSVPPASRVRAPLPGRCILSTMQAWPSGCTTKMRPNASAGESSGARTMAGAGVATPRTRAQRPGRLNPAGQRRTDVVAESPTPSSPPGRRTRRADRGSSNGDLPGPLVGRARRGFDTGSGGCHPGAAEVWDRRSPPRVHRRCHGRRRDPSRKEGGGPCPRCAA